MKEAMDDYKNAMVDFSKTNPEEFRKFSEFAFAALKDGKLNSKTKELIAVGISVAVRCSYCIYLHTKEAFKAGATEEEIREAATVAVLMGGGPALTYITELKKAIDYCKDNNLGGVKK